MEQKRETVREDLRKWLQKNCDVFEEVQGNFELTKWFVEEPESGRCSLSMSIVIGWRYIPILSRWELTRDR